MITIDLMTRRSFVSYFNAAIYPDVIHGLM